MPSTLSAWRKVVQLDAGLAAGAPGEVHVQPELPGPVPDGRGPPTAESGGAGPRGVVPAGLRGLRIDVPASRRFFFSYSARLVLRP